MKKNVCILLFAILLVQVLIAQTPKSKIQIFEVVELDKVIGNK